MKEIKKHEECHMKDTCLQYAICPMDLVQHLLSGKRKLIILWYLSYKVLRFSDIKRRLPDITKMRHMLKREPVLLEEGIKKILHDQHFILY